MSEDLFERAGRFRKGYDRRQVEEFLERAKEVWDAGGPPGAMTSWHVRSVGFDMHRDGYLVAEVDTAIDRVEDAFVSREESSGPTGSGEAEDALLVMLERDDGHRFLPASWTRAGYRADEVDRLCHEVREHLVLGRPLPVEKVRTAVFRPRRGRRGYREAAVDAYLDRVVDAMRRRGSL